MNEETKFESAKANPSQVYDDPEDVLKDDSLNDDEKLQVLNTWKSEAIHLQESTAEGFAGGEKSQLDSIESAIHRLARASKDAVLKDLN